MERWFSPTETARIWGKHVFSVYRAIRLGELSAIKIGRRSLRISESEIQRWIESKAKEFKK